MNNIETAAAPNDSGSTERTQTFWTVARKLNLLIVTLTAVGFILFISLVANNMRASLTESATENFISVTELLADMSSSAVRWNKEAVVKDVFDKVTGDGESHLVQMSVFGRQDKPKSMAAEFSTAEFTNDAVKTAISDALANTDDDVHQTNVSNHMVIIMPIRSAKDNSTIGHMLTVWDTNFISNIISTKVINLYLFGLVCLIVLAILLGIVISRGVGRRISACVSIVDEISKGNLDNTIETNSNDELGHLVHALNDVQETLKTGDESGRRAAEFGRIRQALDCATVGVLLADADHNIVYTNDVCAQMLNQNTQLFSDHNNNARSGGSLIGQTMDIFVQHHGINASAISNVVSNQQLEITEAGTSFQVNITPVLDDSGTRHGTVIEWLDRTKEVDAESQVQALVDAAAEGDFSRRIDTTGMDGFYAQIGNMLNNLSEVTELGMNDTLQVLRAISHGQLDARIESNYKGVFEDLRESCNTTTDKLTEIVAQIRESSISVRQGATELSDGNRDISNRTVQQAAHLQETAAAMEQMLATVQQNSESADKANKLAGEARDEAVHGGEVSSKAILAVNKISEASKKISDIIGVIDEIAFQTNLLALNASVEAARAGDKGRGFAVVASEVRELAGRSATAAKEIKELIDDSVSKVVEGERLVGESGDALNAIVGSVKKVSDIVSDIAHAGIEQTQGINQINTSITQIDTMTQRNAVLAEDASTTSETVGQQAQQLDNLVSFFTTDRNSSSSSANQTKPDTAINRQRAA